MRTFKHLSLEEREVLYGGLKEGLPLREIARRLGRSHTTLIRELAVNSKGRLAQSNASEYLPCKAHAKAVKRAANQRRKAPLKEPSIFLYVRRHLREDGWSPETIAGRLTIKYPDKSIDDETIYRYIYKDSMKQYKYWQYLTKSRKKRMKKNGRHVRRNSKIPGSVSIDLRPEVVNKRTRFGDWETDNMEGKKSDRKVVSATVERLSRLTLLSRTTRKAESKTRALNTRLVQFPKKLRLTLTADNGAENSYHRQITDNTGMQIFFCHAYHAWEKGTVENTIGRIRKYVPKGESIDTLSDEQIAAIEYKLNHTPRKCLGYLTPYEKMMEVLQKD